MGATRRRCPAATQVDVLIEQDNRCLYCGHRFGDLVVRKGNDWQWLEINWDHFVPHVYSQANPNDGWVAACHLCNSYKADLMFMDIRAVRLHVMDRAVAHEHDPLPFWHCELAATFEPEPAVIVDDSGQEIELPRLATAEEIAADVAELGLDDEPDQLPRAYRLPVDVDEWLATHGDRMPREAPCRDVPSRVRDAPSLDHVDAWLAQHGER